ncbi:MAG: carboxylating nicotinate-nucleotide diphosphorylase [Chloroflexi bacterium]|nr:carboxylating nicotinate-nucleotide diphosphorylase [Chloroflexota bacterium]
MTAPALPFSPDLIDDVLRRALAEDVGAGDITTLALVPADQTGIAAAYAKEAGVLAGNAIAARVFTLLDSAVHATPLCADGDVLTPGARFLRVEGPLQAILTGERVALNSLRHLSGIATLTRAFVKAVEGTAAQIIDTRKTTPGLRLFEKYAVRVGGGQNHRIGLFDGVLIKDNHIAACGSVSNAVKKARASVHHLLKIEIEAKTMEQVAEALEAGADGILLDNMSPDTMAQAVALVGGRAFTEASGNITLVSVRDAARSGVDLISVGMLTHSAPALDISLDIEG